MPDIKENTRFHVFAATDGRDAEFVVPKGKSAAKKRKGPRREPDVLDSYYVERTRLVQSLCDSLERDGLVALCAEKGMGRHVLARQVSEALRGRGVATLELKVSGLIPESVCRKVKAALRDALDREDGGSKALVVIDGLGLLDDPYLARMARSVASGVVSGCRVIVLLDPDCESMLEFLPDCRVVRAAELALESREYKQWDGLLGGFSEADAKRCTHGIPSLLGTLRGVRCNPDGTPFGPLWDRAAADLLHDALRPELIDEELSVRAVMVALGAGDFQALSELGLRASRDILKEIESGCPLFGVDLHEGTFELVACTNDVVGQALSSLPAEYSGLIAAAVRLLAKRGHLRRAAAIASAQADASVLRTLVAEYPLELVDAGLARLAVREVGKAMDVPELCLARTVLEEVGAPLPKCGGIGASHARAAEGWAVGDAAGDPVRIVNPMGSGVAAPASGADAGFAAGPAGAAVKLPQRARRIQGQIALLRAIHEVKRCGTAGMSEDERLAIAAKGDVLAMRLIARLNVLEMRLGGQSIEAFRELLLVSNLREQVGEPSVYAAILALEFEGLRCLVGDPESAGDVSRLRKAQDVLEEGALFSLRCEAESVLSMSYEAMGVNTGALGLDKLISVLEARGETAALAWVRLVECVAELRAGAYRNAHVRAAAAFDAAVRTGLADVAVAAKMLERAAMLGLGEGPGLGEEWKIAGIEPLQDLAMLDKLHEAVAGDALGAADGVCMAMRGLMPRTEARALAGCIVSADRVVGREFGALLPLPWKPKRGAVVASADCGSEMANAYGVGRRSAVTLREDVPTLEVNVLGAFAVRRGGARLGESAWHRRRSRDLLSMLGLTPGHVLTRREAINQLWQDMDPVRGRENLYSVLSSLRSTVGQAPPEVIYILGEQGKIWLNDGTVSCDVDEFERIARQLMARRLPDDEAISLCLRLEGMYGHGSYLPASDAEGRYRRRHEELSRRFVDAMMTGVDAATRLHDERQAKWFLETVRIEREDGGPTVALG